MSRIGSWIAGSVGQGSINCANSEEILRREEPVKRHVEGDGITGLSRPTTGGGAVQIPDTLPSELNAGARVGRLGSDGDRCEWQDNNGEEEG